MSEARWIVEAVTEHGALLFIWLGRYGSQPVLMPGYTFYWWLDESPVYEEAEGDGSHRRLAN